ncbi:MULTISPECIES: hypothetical protein [Mycobacteriaceae]|uniref:hypothetical protein n=1 Tax=Mycobacteriaceae TaxID=1762 RepID=UPI0007487655|nr:MULTISPECIES: hypothetical protein [Mycobacteriaceae]KUH69792.1 hypothetical protein AU183_26510 [Mycolicibacterium novocastrense]KUH70272.1 hypothetical protein AU072_11790 [Mycolicibacterium novocastrense]KUH71582.1 hypothetical protein AU184_27085 [Mycolicibacterium novocastrense]OBB45731.1 hypothetical protein A5752_26850 [Mycobacterium sp. 852002-51961_SCH5331710]OBG89253.1 hypothetical protein A5698_23445 [Mycobacterium sp. E136]
MRSLAAVFAALATPALMLTAPTAEAQPPLPPLPPPGAECNSPNCTPGIQPGVVLGSYCNNTTYYAFGVTSWGRLVFCGSPRRYEPRWFRSPEMHGVKLENDLCPSMDGEVAQAPDGLFLTCVSKDGRSYWERGDL